jgi:hypothetical protein
MANPSGHDALDDLPGQAGTQIHAPQLGVVTKVYPSKSLEDPSDYFVDVRLLELGGAEDSDDLEHAQVPVTTDHLGSTRGITTNTMVFVQFVNGDPGRPLVTEVLYADDDRAPITAKGDWRVRVADNTVLEVTRDSAGDQFIRIGRQPTDGEDLDMGLQLNMDTGQVELHDGSDQGLCSDGEGNWVMDAETFYFPGLSPAYSTTPYSANPGGPTPSSNVSWAESSSSRDVAQSQFQTLDTGPSSARDLPRPQTQTVDLGAEGLASGDNDGPYLDDHFKSGNTVIIPPGTYSWDGSGLDGSYRNAELIGGGKPATGTNASNTASGIRISTTGSTSSGPGERSVLQIPSGLDTDIDVVSTGGGDGSVHIKNIEIDGTWGKGGCSFSVRDPESSMIVENFHSIGGNQSESLGSDSQPIIFVPISHAGTLYLRNLNLQNFGNHAIYASAPGLPPRGGRLGRTIVEGGLFKNNNIANIRVGGVGSAIRKVVSVQDGSAPLFGSVDNPRSMWVKDRVEAEITDCDIVHQDGQEVPISLGGGTEGDLGASGTLSNCRIQNDTSNTPIEINAGDWTGEGNSLTGSGDTTSPEAIDTSGTESPSTTPRYV